MRGMLEKTAFFPAALCREWISEMKCVCLPAAGASKEGAADSVFGAAAGSGGMG